MHVNFKRISLFESSFVPISILDVPATAMVISVSIGIISSEKGTKIGAWQVNDILKTYTGMETINWFGEKWLINRHLSAMIGH